MSQNYYLTRKSSIMKNFKNPVILMAIVLASCSDANEELLEADEIYVEEEISIEYIDENLLEINIPTSQADAIIESSAGSTDISFTEKRTIMADYLHKELLGMDVSNEPIDASNERTQATMDGVAINGAVMAEIGIYYGGGWHYEVAIGTHTEWVQATEQYETDFSPTVLGAYSALYAEHRPGSGYSLRYSGDMGPQSINCPSDAAKTKATSRFYPRSDGELTWTGTGSQPTNIYIYAYVKCD